MSAESLHPVWTGICSTADYEIELDQFCIRNNLKKNEIADASSKQKIFEFIPLMLSDALRCVPSSKPNVFYAFDGVVAFWSFVLHALVVGHHGDTDNYYKYFIDDGTVVAPLAIYKDTKESLAVSRLQCQVEALTVGQAAAQKQMDTLDCLRRLLAQARRQIDMSHIPVGAKVFVQGRPHRYRNETSVNAYSVYVDEQRDRGMELAFKDQLIDWYAQEYPTMGVQL